MPDELNDSKAETGAKDANPASGTTPSGESNPTPLKETVEAKIADQSQPGTVAHTPPKPPKIFLWLFGEKWGIPLWHGTKMVIGFLSGLVSLLWTFALWDSYRPKITVTPGPTFNSKEPFSTAFIIQNQGALPIRHVSFNCTWTYADDANQARNVYSGVMAIPELEPLEQHAMVGPSYWNVGTNTLAPSVQIVAMPVDHHSLVLWFDVTYDPQFFGQRTTTLYFLGGWDSETNFQWLPTGNGDIRAVPADAMLMQKASKLAKSMENKRISMLKTNNAAKTNNIVHTNGSPIRATNSSVKAHAK